APAARSSFETSTVVEDTPHSDSAAAVPWTISGAIIDSRVDLAVKSDSIELTFDKRPIPGTRKGNFSVTTRFAGRHVFRFNAPGYNEVIQEIVLTHDNKQPFVVIATSPTGHDITRREIVVSAKAEPLHTSAEIAKNTITRKDMKRTAATFSDPMRVLQTLPGVTSSSDVSSRPIVRGGEVNQTRIYLDGISLMQPYHYGGLHSTFNQLALDNMTLYSSGFPAYLGNSLSALVDARMRRPAEEPFDIAFDLNLLQSSAFVSVPFFDSKAGVNASWQGSYYQHVVNLMMAMFADDATKKDFEHLTLPDYNDFTVGFQYRPNEKWSFSLSESFNSDMYLYSEGDSLIPLEAHFFTPTHTVYKDTVYQEDYYYPYKDLSYYYPSADSVHVGKAYYDLDTLMILKSRYNVLSGNARYTPDENWVFSMSLAWQKRWWDLDFPDGVSSYIDTSRYDVSINQGNAAFGAMYSGIDDHLLHAGLQLDATRSEYDVYLVRFLHKLIREGNITANDFIGPMTGDTATTFNNVYYSDFYYNLSQRLLVNYKGDRDFVNGGLYINDNWTINEKLSANIGMRLEGCSADSSVTLSPRFSLKYQAEEDLELLASAGRYTQNNYDPAAIALSKKLGPEKTWHADIGAQKRFLPWLTVKSNLYWKSYSGLMSEVIEQRPLPPMDELIQRFFDEYRFADPHPLSEEELIARAIDEYAMYSSSYTNKGTGYAFGWESMLRYEPADFWHGWISLTLGKSMRRRMPGWRKHAFPLERPLLISFVNYYRLPRRYELSVKYRFMSGIPYTPNDYLRGEGYRVADFNSARLAPYQSLDFRIAKGFVTKHTSGHVYIEVWNSLNSPNMFLLDKKTKEIQGSTLNVPFPALVFGLDFDLL
ncbi:MAG: TonB-dependent receptor plug domain-containing protein, partial [Chitinivibrionales bacterium]